MPHYRWRSEVLLNGESDTRQTSRVIDCDVFVGRPAGPGAVEGRESSVDQLLAQMDRLGVDLAVVYHIVALEHAPVIGNQLLLDELNREPRLIPAFVLLPTYTAELPAIDDVLTQMEEASVRMARIFPASGLAGHRFSLREWCIGPLLHALEQNGMPLAVDFSLFRRGEPPWEDVYQLCSHHPDLRLALTDVQGRNNRSLYALMDRFPHLYVSSGGLNVHAGLEDICDRFGADRIFFGSGAPTRSMGAARLVVDRSALSDGERAMVLGGTAASLLGLASDQDVRVAAVAYQ